MKKNIPYKVGDKVFAKLKGYPAWPAKITADNGRNFSVQFYGTGEVGFIKSEDLYYYLKYKHRFGKPSKRKDFNDAIKEIESEIEVDGTDGNVVSNDSISSLDNTLNSSTTSSSNDKKKRKQADDPNAQPAKKTARQRSLNSKAGNEDSILSQEQSSLQTSVSDFDIPKSVTETDENSKSVVEDEPKSPNIENKLKNKTDEVIEEEKSQKDNENVETDIKLLSEENLEVFISYAQYVKDNSTMYKCKI